MERASRTKVKAREDGETRRGRPMWVGLEWDCGLEPDYTRAGGVFCFVGMPGASVELRVGHHARCKNCDSPQPE